MAINETLSDPGAPNWYDQTGELGTLPVLQDVPEVNVWESWAVVYRDVFVLNRCGEQVAVFNLTNPNGIQIEANYEQLRGLIMAAVESGE